MHRRTDRSLWVVCVVGVLVSACATNSFDQMSNEIVDDVAGELASKGIRATPTDRGLSVYLPDVLFAFDSAELSPAGTTALQRVAEILAEHAPGYAIAVEGHTDSTGSELYNLDLSRRRAEVVGAVLTAGGIRESDLTMLGLGEARPAASNEDRAGRQQNRRVEVVVLRDDMPSGAPTAPQP